MNCPLCGFEFEPDRTACSTHCPFGSGCNLVCCPSCGYQGIDENRSRLAAWASRIMRRAAGSSPRSHGAAQPAAGATAECTLSSLEPGVDATVVDLSSMPQARALRLGAFGLAVGARVRVVQRKPVPVLRVGETDLGLEPDVLDQIRVVAAA